MTDVPQPQKSGILLEALSVRVAGRTLIENVDAEFPRAGITLVVGPSGSGKSVLLRLLAGLLAPGDDDFDVTGRITIGGRARFSSDRELRVGIVFQDYALFDELSAIENIRFGRDHGASNNGTTDPRRLLDEFGIPETTAVDLLSGGQKQRLAIARTLAYDPEVIVFDEPTSGLDPANADKVASRIQALQESVGKTTVIVTHDYEHLQHIADRVFLLDAAEKTLRQIDPEALLEDSRQAGAESTAESPTPALPVSKRITRALGDFLAATTDISEAILSALRAALPLWRSARWGFRYLYHYLCLLASPSSFAYFGAAGIIAGFVATYFTFKFLPFKAYTEPLITEELLQGLGFSLYRIIVPVLLTVLLAARCGAAISADVGSRVYSHQIDALSSFGVRPRSYLLTNILWGFVLATPLLTLFGFLLARYTSLLVFLFNYPEHSALFWDGHFHQNLILSGSSFYHGSHWMLAKILIAGLGVGTIAYHQGLRPKRSGVDVSHGITGTIIWGTLFVLLVHFVFAFVEFES